MTHQKYPKYKNSGIEWLGEIPEHWEVRKLKKCSQIKTGRTPKIQNSNTDYFKNGSIDWFTPSDFYNFNGELKDSKRKITEEALINKQVEFFDEFSIFLIGVGATIGKVGYSRKKASANQQINIIKFDKSIFPKYGYYGLLAGKMQVDVLADFTTLPILNQAKTKEIIISLPPKPEQTAIANYLDQKIESINTFITKKKQLIELLKEQKAAIINEAVTKGLDKTVAMKDSGVEWLGEIPEHWEVRKLTGICSFVRGNSSFKKDELLSNGKYVALQYGKTYKVDEVNEEFEFYVNEEFYKESQIVNYGDVIIVSTSETIEDLGHVVFYNRSDLGLLGGEQLILKPYSKIVNEKYLYYSSKIFTKELQKFATGVKVYRFNINDLKTIYTTIPPKSEQTQIVQHIETQTKKIEATIRKIERELDLVEEYKVALISEAVTGKICLLEY